MQSTWTEEDKARHERAEKRARLERKVLSPHEQREKHIAERAFNHAYDHAIRSFASPRVGLLLDLTKPGYVAERRKAFEEWHLDELERQQVEREARAARGQERA